MTPLLAFQADTTGVDYSIGIDCGDQLHGGQPADRRSDRYPRRLLPLAGDRRARTALPAAVLLDQLPAMWSNPWRSSSPATTSPIVEDARHSQRRRAELRLRRLVAVRARQVLRLRPHRGRHARQYRLPLFGALGNGWTANGIARPILSHRRREFVRRARPRQRRRLFRPGNRHVRLRRPDRFRLA